ncbi:Outer membrane lipoprotein [Companilactobacillus paralimentarius DSM 13238 = JCM 10415]|uniref:Lipoprotein n=1 Tax=Companilactobacillus paralimentarius DSM 13238 = JCM 10415 TaxID=1122151 RepID=A0A0R1PIS1_9LACO|nr:MetQ/NlpA family ABC transporter substrate-binding protein [Companilactobacillus paralimentarius]KAE9565435.1 metal ABC transporter substrate-binding protein [Companilactobacillus paralimentarius]KRL29909.1 Outer membrane lipoprotein [Companilactobacillus paralimentarius DSM 13238 = JCM 10415]MDR4933504.1 MetQ/NlpA family ABC transporter substrate-binding protein [Companilactobacillus paralimentarius]QFR69983.1 MetQ/NlpA family ABC transporter substrate-binding protein [Companilactobacillus 
MSKFKNLGKVILLAFTALFIFVLAGCGNQNKEQTVKVGINPSDAAIWKVVKKNVKSEGINLKVVEFNDYNQPNTALVQGEVDINAYQHTFFLNSWNKAHHSDLVSIGKTVIQPMALYSHKITKLSQLKNGAKIAIPNDASNEARALQLLEANGLLKLDSGVKLPSTKNIKENKLNLKFTTLDAAQTARSLDDVDAAIVNGNVASDAKLDPSKAVVTEKVNKKSQPWINIIVTQKKNKDNKTYKKVVKAFQTKSVAKEIKKVYGESAVPAWNK